MYRRVYFSGCYMSLKGEIKSVVKTCAHLLLYTLKYQNNNSESFK